MRIAVVLAALLPTLLTTFVSAQCETSSATPVDPSAIGKIIASPSWCSPGGFQSGTRMRIKPYGVVWDGIAGLGGAGFPICSVEVVALFSKNDKRDKLLYRPPRTPADFKDSHPKLFAKFLKNVYANFPCNSSKVETANVWGPQRARFMPLVARMATGVKEIRDRDCAAEYGGPKRRISVKDLEGYLAKHIVANNALSYLYNLGYVNFFSV